MMIHGKTFMLLFEPCTSIIIRLVLITHTSGTALYIRTGAEDSYGTYSIPGIPYIELAAS
jgi:hypothetical protein